VFTGLTDSTTYYIFARSVENKNYKAGAAARSRVTTNPKIHVAALTVNDHPKDTTVLQAGKEYSLEVTVNRSINDGGTLSYQWYSNSVHNNTGGTPLTGETANTYTKQMNDTGTF
jgi:hypothetical protein